MQSAPPPPGALGSASRRQTTTEKGHDLHRRPGRHQTGGLGGAWPWLDVRTPGKEARRGAAEGQDGRHRDPVVPSTQWDPRK